MSCHPGFLIQFKGQISKPQILVRIWVFQRAARPTGSGVPIALARQPAAPGPVTIARSSRDTKADVVEFLRTVVSCLKQLGTLRLSRGGLVIRHRVFIGFFPKSAMYARCAMCISVRGRLAHFVAHFGFG
jgi:hypothetical protein